MVEIFLSVSANPWRYIDLKGSISAVKIGSLLNTNENRLLVVTLEGILYIFDIFYMTQEYDKERGHERYNDSHAKILERSIIEEEDAE